MKEGKGSKVRAIEGGYVIRWGMKGKFGGIQDLKV